MSIDAFLGRFDPPVTTPSLGLSSVPKTGPVVKLVSSPTLDIERALAHLDDADPVQRRITRRSIRGRGRFGLGMNEKGERVALFDGRECCAKLADEKFRIVQDLRLPHEFTCLECRSVMAIEIGVLRGRF